MSAGTAIRPTCRGCGEPIRDMSWLSWNGHDYHDGHLPSSEPPPVFEVAELHDDLESSGMWVGFKTAADRERARLWFKVTA